MTAPYRYHTLTAEPYCYGSSYARGRARQDAARIALRTGQTVELHDPARGVFHVRPWTERRAQWSKVAEAEGRTT